tara:strand:+ start:248 stop:952 length:705 start_codon:yes stop_codon:yes gene_type:complete
MSKNKYRYLNLYYWLRKLSFTKFFQKNFFLSNNFKRKIIFNLIFKSYHWRDYHKTTINESDSGLGSDLIITKQLIKDLDIFFKNNQITSILDIACGDFFWMNKLISNNKHLNYLGLEIVKSIVKNNNKIFSNQNVNFKCSDVINEGLPQNYDFILVRDFLIHIKNTDIINLVQKIKKSNCKYFAINNFPNIKKNDEIKGYGHHRYVNIEIPPFNLTNAYKVIDDHDRKLNIYKI